MSGDPILRQEPKIEVGYWPNRSKKFNGEIEKGINGTAPKKTPSPAKKPKQEKKEDAKNPSSEPDQK